MTKAVYRPGYEPATVERRNAAIMRAADKRFDAVMADVERRRVLRCRRHGGLVHWRIGRLGGSIYGLPPISRLLLPRLAAMAAGFLLCGMAS